MRFFFQDKQNCLLHVGVRFKRAPVEGGCILKKAVIFSSSERK